MWSPSLTLDGTYSFYYIWEKVLFGHARISSELCCVPASQWLSTALEIFGDAGKPLGLHGNRIITSLFSSCCRQTGAWPSSAVARRWLHRLITHTELCMPKSSLWTLPATAARPYAPTCQGGAAWLPWEWLFMFANTPQVVQVGRKTPDLMESLFSNFC